MTDTFLPTNYELTKSNVGNYFKIQDGETIKIRILSNSIIGWEYFKDEGEKLRPIRKKVKFDTTPGIKKDTTQKEFRAFTIFNYETESVQIWEITQSKIKEAIFNLYKDPDFGDPKGYDLKITRTGKGLDTKYSVFPLSKSVFDNKEVLEEAGKVNLEALYDGEDPFNPLPF